MATNPMQRKARLSFFLGMFLMLLITGSIIALLILRLNTYIQKDNEEKDLLIKVAVLKEDVKSGQIITKDMLQDNVEVNKKTLPENAIGKSDMIKNYYLKDKEGNELKTKYDEDGNATLYINKDGTDYDVIQEKIDKQDRYFIEDDNGNKQYIELNNIPIVAKVNMLKNTVLTRETVTQGNDTTSDDVRKQEYNVIVLPTQIQTGDYIDIRLSLPTGEDYIVVSKKEVEIPELGDTTSTDTIWVNLTEDEILLMNSAIVDAFRMDGSKLYATTYTEPGMQQASDVTYVPRQEVWDLIRTDENVVQEAYNYLNQRYFGENNYGSSQRNRVNANIQNNETTETNLKSKIQESITKSQEERKTYLNSLSGE